MALTFTGALRDGETICFLWRYGRKKSFLPTEIKKREFVLMSKQLTLTDFDAVIGLYNGVTRYCDGCKNLNCLVPRCDDRDVSRRRARDHVESSVALN